MTGTVTVWVYEKNGLCRGPAIYQATFWGVYNYPGRHQLAVAGPSPLSGLDPVYTVSHPMYIPNIKQWFLEVEAPGHAPWILVNVQDGETHHVWLNPL